MVVIINTPISPFEELIRHTIGVIDPVELVILFLNLDKENDYNEFIWSYINSYINVDEISISDIDLVELYISDLLTRTYDELRVVGLQTTVIVTEARKIDNNSIIITFI